MSEEPTASIFNSLRPATLHGVRTEKTVTYALTLARDRNLKVSVFRATYSRDCTFRERTRKGRVNTLTLKRIYLLNF